MDRRCIAGAGTASLRLAWTRTYTADGLVTSVAFDGTGSAQGSDTLTYTYDGMGRPDQLKRGTTVLTDSAWNPDGTLASRADGSLGTSSFTYDWADRLTAATSPLYSGATGFAWRLDGLLAGRTWPGLGDALSAAYDAAKRPTELVVGDVAFERTYARDGLVTSETSTIGSPLVVLDTNAETQAFSYDGLGRLTASDLPGTARDRAYAYDRNGNRTGATLGASATTYAYDRSDALVSQSVDGGAAASFGYDRSGNLTTNAESAAGATSLTYDLGDRLTGIDPPGQAATSFSFDALGRHRTRVTPAGSDTFDYVGGEELVWRITTGAASVTSAIDAAGNRAATASGGATGYLVPDLHGNFAAALSPAGTVINAIRYDGYGVTLDEFSASGIATPWRFQGRLDLSPDPATPLYDLSARNYSPGLGAFTSFDSVRGQIAEPLSMNRYLYAHASPSTLTDPTGRAVYMKDSGRRGQIRDTASRAQKLVATNRALVSVGARPIGPSRSLTAPHRQPWPTARAAGPRAASTRQIDLATPERPFQWARDQMVLQVREGWSGASFEADVTLAQDAMEYYRYNYLDEAVARQRFWEETSPSLYPLAFLDTDQELDFWRLSAVGLSVAGTDAFVNSFTDLRTATPNNIGPALTGSSSGTTATPPRGGLRPVEIGRAGVSATRAEIEAAGGSIVGTEVTVQTAAGRTRVDLVAELPNGATAFIEVKTGPQARLNPNQAVVLPEFRRSGGTPVGRNAGDLAGRPIDSPVVWVIYRP